MDVDAAVDSVAAELYALGRDAFVRERDARAREAGDRDVAARIRKLRKSTVAASLVNRFVRDHPDRVQELRELGDELRVAHGELDGVRIRELSTRRQALVDELSTMVTDDASGAVLREVRDTFDAAIADPGAADIVACGQLASALHPGSGLGDDAVAWFPSGAERVDRRRSGRDRDRSEREPEKRDPEQRNAGQREAERREPGQRSRARREQERKEQSEQGRRERERQEQLRAEKLREERERLRELRAALATAREGRNEAVAELRAAEAAEAEARRCTARAHKALERADRRLGDADAALAQYEPRNGVDSTNGADSTNSAAPPNDLPETGPSETDP